MRNLARLLAALLVAASVTTLARADTLPPLDCTFETGVSWTYKAGRYDRTTPATLTFSIRETDLEGQTARLVVNGREVARPLRVVRALNANHFMEVAQEGFLNVTTIYDRDAATGVRPAIHSRHLGVLGEPVFAQYAGSCREP